MANLLKTVIPMITNHYPVSLVANLANNYDLRVRPDMRFIIRQSYTSDTIMGVAAVDPQITNPH